MSELREPVWSIISERGVEASNLTYDQARELETRLVNEKIYGCAIVTDEAASRVGQNKSAAE